MTRKNAFSLIELLVVIAIIAILAAIIFPVFSRVKENAYRAGDLSNMNAIRNGLQLYRADQGAYPPAILGYASVYLSGPQMGQIIPASSLRAALYPHRIDSVSTMRPAFDRNSEADVTVAHWPNVDSRAFGSAPVKDTDGNGIINGLDDTAGTRQAYGPDAFYCDPSTGATCDVGSFASSQANGTPLYKVSGYDVAQVQTPLNTQDHLLWEIHYTLRWSNFAMAGGNRTDDPRQLIYNDPPDDTIITWDSWFRDYTSGHLPVQAKKDFVLFQGGGARAYDSATIAAQSWRARP